MTAYGGGEVQLHLLTSARDGGRRWTSRSGCFTHWIWRWVCPTTGLNVQVDRKVRYMIYLTAIGLSPGDSSTVHTNNTQNDTKQIIHRTTQ